MGHNNTEASNFQNFDFLVKLIGGHLVHSLRKKKNISVGYAVQHNK